MARRKTALRTMIPPLRRRPKPAGRPSPSHPRRQPTTTAAAPPGHGPVDGRQPARHLRQRVLRQEPPPAGLRQPAQGPADHRQGGRRQRPGRLRRGRHPARDLGPHRARPARTASRSACRTTGPGILKKQIPLIFGKLLYGSKFHRLRMSRGQQGIGISAAGMYGLLTTGKPVKIMSKVSQAQAGPLLRNPDRHQAEPARDPQRPGRGRRDSARRAGRQADREARHRVDRAGPRHAGHHRAGGPLPARPRQRRRVSRTDGHRQPARGDPLRRSRRQRERLRPGRPSSLPPEPKEIKPHPYGVELGRLVAMLKETKAPTIVAVPGRSRFRGSAPAWPGGSARRRRSARGRTRRRSAGTRPTCSTRRSSRRRFPPRPPTASSPIGEELILKGLHQVVPGEFYAAATRPPAVYRGNPFQIEVGLAYGGASPAHRVSARGAGRAARRERRPHAAAVPHQHLRRPGRRGGRQDPRARPKLGTRVSPGRLKPADDRPAARGHAERQPQRRPDDERAALRQPRAAAVPGRRPAPSRRR